MNAQLSLPINETQRRMTQLEAVQRVMCWGNWKTFKEIVDMLWMHNQIRASEAGVSARLRDLRKLGYTVEKRVRSGNLWEYRVTR